MVGEAVEHDEVGVRGGQFGDVNCSALVAEVELGLHQ